MDSKIKNLFVVLNFVLPVFVFAATLGTILDKFSDIFDLIVPVLMILATIIFIWGIIMYILAAGSDDRKKEAKNLIIWGLIALFVIVAMWGLVKVIGGTFGIEEKGIPRGPGDINRGPRSISL